MFHQRIRRLRQANINDIKSKINNRDPGEEKREEKPRDKVVVNDDRIAKEEKRK